MKIICCLKQVPDTKNVRLDPKTNTLSREGVESIMNPFDRHALEEGVRLKEKFGGRVVALSMGPPQAEAMLREAVSCGADEAVLISDRAFAGADTWATTYTLSMAIKHLGGADLILCGKQAIDGDTAQVGPGLAERMGVPYASYVKKICSYDNGLIILQRMMDDGYDELSIPIPSLLTVVKEINEPRIPSLKGKMKAKKVVVPMLNASDIGADPMLLGLQGSPTQVVKVFAPEAKSDRTMISGTVDEVVDQISAKIKALLC